MEIKKISKQQAWDIRHVVMWPDKDYEYIKLKDDDEGFHYGLYIDGVLVSVVSLFPNGEKAQFRKFATLKEYQGKGYGTKLLQYVFDEASRLGVKKLWCNARIDKSAFYEKFGLQVTNCTFEKSGIEYVIMESS
ncbi:GNAT family N-acetyltransferase [Texcoconibacillus texcoconensis]|nr:GNAT family N-acetyltransferase [Texcoconibacillus texcoconensis]